MLIHQNANRAACLFPEKTSSINEAFKAPSPAVEAFQQRVAARGVFVRVRKEMGADIAGACGQLALTLPSPSESQRRCVCVCVCVFRTATERKGSS